MDSSIVPQQWAPVTADPLDTWDKDRKNEAKCSTIGYKMGRHRGEKQGLLPYPFCNPGATKDKSLLSSICPHSSKTEHLSPCNPSGESPPLPKRGSTFHEIHLSGSRAQPYPSSHPSHCWSVNQVWRAAPSLNHLIWVWKTQDREAEGVGREPLAFWKQAAVKTLLINID